MKKNNKNGKNPKNNFDPNMSKHCLLTGRPEKQYRTKFKGGREVSTHTNIHISTHTEACIQP